MASGDGLAKVTYLFGGTPPAGAASPSPDAESERLDLQDPGLPEFASFFGDAATDESKANRAPVDEPEERSEPTNKREVRAGSVDPQRVSMHALTRRGMSRWELEKTLISRELDEQTVQQELDRLEGVGLLDDAALAETLVRTQHDRKGLGRGAITAELRRRHIDQEHIDAALEQLDDDDEQSRATEIAIKRAGQLSSYDLGTAKRRLSAFMMRKGYSSAIIRIAVDEALADRSSGVRFR